MQSQPATTKFDLSTLSWTLRGFSPFQWKWERSAETGMALVPEVPALPAKVPGSVQAALRAAEVLPDWNVGLNSRLCEWVEHRHWVFETVLPNAVLGDGKSLTLKSLGLDGPGWVLVNGVEVGRFANSHVPLTFTLDAGLKASQNRLQIVFDCPPRWLGQYGYTSRMTDWKPRFNYTWDWSPRLVQIGIWGEIWLEAGDAPPLLDAATCRTSANGVNVTAAGGPMRLTLRDGETVLRTADFTGELAWSELPVQPWNPNGAGEQPLYDLTLEALDPIGRPTESRTWRVGFKSIKWLSCKNAPADADPWVCQINGRPTFIQGVNWTPILPNFADVTDDQYRQRLAIYRDTGVNLLRVWGGAVLEKEIFYTLCDEMGFLVWQEFPLSSSAVENWPPEDPGAIDDLVAIATSYNHRRQHHACLLMWCGGNELQGDLAGGKIGIGRPVDNSHPLMARLNALVAQLDPDRRFVPTSASGPRFTAEQVDFGKNLHWDVHGPWNVQPAAYWEHDDALFRSEVGVPSASPAAMIREFAGGLPELPASLDNPLWRRSSWWIQWAECLSELGREPRDLEEFVAWSQARQSRELVRAITACKNRFPACGGIILWMGHDCFPCAANTSIIDFHGHPKPAVAEIRKVFLNPIESLQ